MWALFYQRKSYASCFNHTKRKTILFIKINEHFLLQACFSFFHTFFFFVGWFGWFSKAKTKAVLPKIKDPLLFCMYNKRRKSLVKSWHYSNLFSYFPMKYCIRNTFSRSKYMYKNSNYRVLHGLYIAILHEKYSENRKYEHTRTNF